MSEPICCEWCKGNVSGYKRALHDVVTGMETLDPTDLVSPTYAQAIRDVKDIIENLRGEA